MDKPIAKITHVAIMYNGKLYSLPAPNRHHNVIGLIYEQTGDTMRGTNEQGFLDEEGMFLRRAPALIRAEQTGQLKAKKVFSNQLYSEDLW
jgi:hypothetical protein